MSFGDHIEDLRRPLVRDSACLVSFLLLGFALDGLGTWMKWEVGGFQFGVGRPAMQLIARPVEEQLGKFYEKRRDELMAKWREDVEAGRIEGESEMGLFRSA